MFVCRLPRPLLAVLAVLISSLAVAAPQRPAPAGAPPGPISIEVDASQAAQSLFHSRLTMPVTPGPLALLYPKWIPGEHGPTGPIVNSAGMKFTAGGRVLPWRRDDVEMYAIHLDIPPGASQLEIALDYLAPVSGQSGFSGGASSTDKMAVLSWNWLVLYPAGFTAGQLTYRPTLKLPAGWKFGTALPLAPGAPQSQTVVFQPATLNTLIDSPVIMGEYYRAVPLSPAGEARPTELDIAADSAAALNMTPDEEAHYRQLVAEAGALFGARHYRDYHFLLSLSQHVAHFGLEHHESNDSRTSERGLIDDSGRKLMAGLLPHEYVHSWNGKYRRPLGLSTPDYEQPMKGELLWVYEGLTTYLGDVLTARSGLLSADQYREDLAMTAAGMSHRPGRQWRPLLDTTVAAQVLYEAPEQWSSWRRSVDFYPEGELIWLEADATIRRLSNNQKSLDDFCKLFFGPPDQPLDQAPHVKPYTFDELVAAMNQVAAYDWRKFFNDRVDYVGPNAPLGGIEGSGWKLVYNDTPSEMNRLRESRELVDAAYSLGLIINGKTNRVLDSIFFMPAYQAGIVPGMQIAAVNGRKFTPDVLHQALKAAKSSSAPIQLLVENDDYFKTYSIDYHEGDKYPHLERDTAKPDLLGDIVRAKSSGQ